MKSSKPVKKRGAKNPAASPTDEILHHWREAVPNDRLAHLVKDATRGPTGWLGTKCRSGIGYFCVSCGNTTA